MMKKLIIALLLFSSISAFSQNVTQEEYEKDMKPLKDKVISLQLENTKLRNEVRRVNSKILNITMRLDSLNKQTNLNENQIVKASNELVTKIQETGNSGDQKILDVNKSLNKKALNGLIGGLLILTISGLLYWLLRNRQKSDKSDFVEQLSKTKLSIEESLIKEFGKQTTFMETNLKLIEDQKNVTPASQNVILDHSLALKVANEINLIERNVNLMDSKTKGLKQLVASIGKLKDNLAANGYEIPVLLGKMYHQGMKLIITSSVPDENLEKGSEVITKIIIPQVNYNDKMIQTAQIEVSVGY